MNENAGNDDNNNAGNIVGKTALVTGGSRGIGAAVAWRLAQGGANVVLTYVSDEKSAAQVVDRIEGTGRRALAVRADSGDVGDVKRAVDTAASTFGGLDILVNNAGVMQVGPVEEFAPEDFDRTMAVNVRAPFVASQAAAGHMSTGGRIVNIGSNMAERTVFPGFSLYAMSKTALAGMTKGMARDLGSRGITVNLVHPGATDTDANPADGPNADTINGFTALGHYAAPDDIAAAVAYLASSESRYITGTTISVDGGFAI